MTVMSVVVADTSRLLPTMRANFGLANAVA